MGVFIIAEAGVNHNGSRETALRMIDAAKECGCDCIKFQTFQTEELVTTQAEKAAYQAVNTGGRGSQYHMLKPLELDCDDFYILQQHCVKAGIEFMSTPFDIGSVQLLERMHVSRYKISSGDITDKQLMEYVADTGKPIILSTGMSTLEEIEEAVGWIEDRGNTGITLLHCTSDYPADYSTVNMRAMLTMKERFSYSVGYSDHTQGIQIPIMAAVMGAEVIEKHFTLDKKMEGPDHKASLEPGELAEMVKGIRAVEAAFGDGIKCPAHTEIHTRHAARKSVIVNKPLPKGTQLTDSDLAVRRPGTGIEPKYLEQLKGKRLRRDVRREEVLQWKDIE